MNVALKINTPLDYVNPKIGYQIYAPGKFRYIFLEDYYFQYFDLTFVFKKGFIFDLASSPKCLWPIFSPHDAGIIATAIHDILCNKKGILRQVSDDFMPDESCIVGDVRMIDSVSCHRIFYEIMLIDNIHPTKAFIGHLGVRYGGPKWNGKRLNYNWKKYRTDLKVA